MPRVRAAALVAIAAAAVSACSDRERDYGVPVGWGEGQSFYDRGYFAGGYDSPDGEPYWGWWEGYYYPGAGDYVYDAYRRAYSLDDRYGSYWNDRRRAWRGDRRRMTENWTDYHRDPRSSYWNNPRGDRYDYRRGNAPDEEYQLDPGTPPD